MIKTKTTMFAAIALLLAGFAAGWAANGWRLSGEVNQLETDYASHLATQQAASADVISRTLLRERQLRKDNEEIQKDAETEQKRLIDELADSDAAARWLSEQLDRVSGRISADAGTAGECQAARSAVIVLTDVLERYDKVAGEFATAADGSRIAGLACERAYDAAMASSAN